MKKKIDNDKSKRVCKNVVYVAVLVSIALASLISVLPLKRTVESLADERDVQKIFSVDNDTISNEPADDIKSKQDAHANEVISFIRQDENSKDDSKKSVRNDCEKNKEESVAMQDVGDGTPKKSVVTQDVGDIIPKKSVATQDVGDITPKKSVATQDEGDGTSKKSVATQDEGDGTSKKSVATQDEGDGTPKETQKSDDKANEVSAEETNREVFFCGNTSCIVPLNGDIIRDYSKDKLVYFKPQDEWRVHRGIDIRAKEGTKVKAIMDGYVERIESDSKNGTTLVIRHSKKETSVYKNLANDDLVMPNQIIKQGDVIGSVGDWAGCGGDNHLHFEITKNGKLVNPKNYIQFNEK